MKKSKHSTTWSPRRDRPMSYSPDAFMRDSIDMYNRWNESYAGPMMDNWSRMMESLMDPIMRGPGYWNRTYQDSPGRYRREGHYNKDACRCQPKDCYDCDCQCCVADADLLVRTRAGERRVVPITIENTYRREREIELEMSSWTTPKDKSVVVQSEIPGPTQFKLAPCEEHVVKIITNVAIQQDSDSTNDNKRIDLDVDSCQVVYADLRIKGCDIRPIRIALAILPCHCETYHADCQCTCC